MQANRQQAKGQEGQRNQAKARMLSNQRASSPVFWSLPFCVFESSQVKFILPTKINNTAPPLVSGAGSSRAPQAKVFVIFVFLKLLGIVAMSVAYAYRVPRAYRAIYRAPKSHSAAD